MAKDAAVAVTWEMDPKALEEIATADYIGEEIDERINKAIPIAVEIAPFRTGHYKERFKRRRRITRVSGMRRQTGFLMNTDRKAWAVEWGRGAHHTQAQVAELMRTLR